MEPKKVCSGEQTTEQTLKHNTKLWKAKKHAENRSTYVFILVDFVSGQFANSFIFWTVCYASNVYACVIVM